MGAYKINKYIQLKNQYKANQSIQYKITRTVDTAGHHRQSRQMSKWLVEESGKI